MVVLRGRYGPSPWEPTLEPSAVLPVQVGLGLFAEGGAMTVSVFEQTGVADRTTTTNRQTDTN